MSKRKNEEKMEGLEEVKSDVPDSRFQGDQQVQNTDQALKTVGADSDFTLKENQSKGSTLKQEKVSKVILNADSGSVSEGMGISGAGTRGSSGTFGGILGAANGTPVADKSRSDSRYGKKLDRIATKLNYTPSEQVLQGYDESKPLAESKDSDQGYNGTYRNEYARSQKKVGNTPAELMFDRSVDYILKDELYFGQGQYNKQSGVITRDDPTIQAAPNALGIYVYPTDANGRDVENYSQQSGNYLHRFMNVTVNSVGKVTDLCFDEIDLSNSIDAETANKAGASAMIDRNTAELDRQMMDQKAGDEKADIWTSMARAIKQPTQVVSLMRDYEAMMGNEMFLAYKKAQLSLSSQLNRGVKDGQTLVDPAVEALLGILEAPNSSAVLRQVYPSLLSILNSTNSAVKDLNSKGQAGVMIQLYDSIQKYKTKADLLLQPRSFRMHLQTADNNIDPLRVHKRFAQAVAATETFSTIDREYDPLMPICVTDKAAIIHRHSFNQMCSFVDKAVKGFTLKTSVSGGTTFNNVPLAGRSNVPASKFYLHALTDDNTSGHGAFTYTVDKANKQVLVTPNTDFDNGKKIYYIINTDSTRYSSGITVGSETYYEHQAAIDVSIANGLDLKAQVPNDVDVIEYENHKPAIFGGSYHYCYSDLRNSYLIDMHFPLIQGIIDYIEKEIGSKLYDILPGSAEKKTISIPMVHSTMNFSLFSFMVCAAAPFILNDRVNSFRDLIYYEKNVEYPFEQLEKIKNVGLKEYTNFGFNGYDSPIECRTMNPASTLRWIMPEIFWTVSQTKNSNGVKTANRVVAPFYLNEENFKLGNGTISINDDHSAMTMPSIRYGARLGFLDMLYGMSEKDIRLSYDCVVPFIPTRASGGFVYKYDKNSDGIIGFILSNSSSVDADISIKEWLSRPRELGFVADAPYGVLTPKVTSLISTAGTVSSSLADEDESATRGSSFRIRYYTGSDPVTHTFGSGSDNILGNTSVNINRAVNFSQVWFEVVANGKQPTVDHGMIFSMNRAMEGGSLAIGESKFTPFVEYDGSASSSVYAVSLMKAVWPRLQKLPFVISPFEGGDMVATSGSVNTSYDPFELAYYFGLCGFRASDYRESVYNREKEVVNLGYTFVSDPWVEASPIFKEGSRATGVETTKGYILK